VKDIPHVDRAPLHAKRRRHGLDNTELGNSRRIHDIPKGCHTRHPSSVSLTSHFPMRLRNATDASPHFGIILGVWMQECDAPHTLGAAAPAPQGATPRRRRTAR
jgi:hypothetical protein